MGDVCVRAARHEDAEAVAALKVAAWRAAYPGIVPRDVLDALDVADETRAWRAYLEDLPPGDRLWLAVHGDRVVGYARTGPGEVHGLYAAPDLIGAGVGGALLEHAVSDFARRGFEVATLWHFAGNDRAAGFYEHLGFRLDGARRGSEHGADELRRVRPLA